MEIAKNCNTFYEPRQREIKPNDRNCHVILYEFETEMTLEKKFFFLFFLTSSLGDSLKCTLFYSFAIVLAQIDMVGRLGAFPSP